jgi:hypothetical protein
MIIRTEKIVTDDGVIGRKIISVEGIKKGSELPSLYANQGRWIKFNETGYIEIGKNMYTIEFVNVGEFIDEEEFQKVMKIIRKCGYRLTRCNRRLAKLRSEWNGVEELEI